MILWDFIVKQIQERKLGRKITQNVIVRSYLGAKLDCISHYAIPTIKSNPNRIIIQCGTNNLKMDESQDGRGNY